jgi:hypothetical protein
MDTHQAKIEVDHEEWTAAKKTSQERMGASIGAMEACLETKKPTPLMSYVPAHAGDSNGAKREEEH